MGQTGLPTVFIDDPSETPDAKKWNDNFSFLNFVPHNEIRNGDFENFTGSLPDFWALSGAGAASASDSDSKRAAKAVKITFGSATAILKQSSPEFKFHQSRRVKAWCFVKTSFASQTRLFVSDGVGSTASSFHTGGGTYELLEVEHIVAAGATELTLEIRVEASGSALCDVAALVDFEEIRGFLPNPKDEAASLGTVIPAGALFPYGGASIPAGFLECNGQAVSRTSFADLFSAIQELWGEGDNSTTFNVPDMRESFPRGHVGLTNKTFVSGDVNTATEEITVTGHGFNRSGVVVRFTTTGTLPAGLSTGTDFFVIFVDANKFQVATTRANAITGTAIDFTDGGSGTHTVLQRLDPDASSRTAMAPGGSTGDNVGARQIDEFRSHTHTSKDAAGNIQSGASTQASQNPTQTGAAGGSETRPANALVKWIIKT